MAFVRKFNHIGNYRKDVELRGEQWLFDFRNGYGASVIKNTASFYDFELAVLHSPSRSPRSKARYDLCYRTPITNDVIRCGQDEDKVSALLEQIKALPRNLSCSHSMR